jgi:hypothetical protein
MVINGWADGRDPGIMRAINSKDDEPRKINQDVEVQVLIVVFG